MQRSTSAKVSVRSVFISDTHLGSRACRATELLEFLARIEADYLFLVGDIVDLESLRRRYFWPSAHQEVLDLLFARTRAGTRVIYIPGNHDADLRALRNSRLGNIEIVREHIHVTADGRRMLVTHGDECDSKVNRPAWLSRLGSVLYDFILRLDRFSNAMRRACGLPCFPLASRIKGLFSAANRYIADFERALASRARALNLDGVICGHIHKPRIDTIEGVLYCNDGDWVESCSALVESADGRLSLVQAEHARPGKEVTRALADALPGD